MNYNNLTLSHFEAATGAGELCGPNVHRGEAGSRAQGTWVRFDVRLEPAAAKNAARLQAAKFLAFACPHVIAICDWLTQTCVGCEAIPALPENVASLRHRFDVPVEKLGRLLIIEDAWIAALSSPHEI